MPSHAERIRGFSDAVNRGDPQNLEGAKEMFAAMKEGFPDLTFSVEHVVEHGDMAAAWLRVTGTHLQEFMGLAPTYNQIDVEGADFLRFSLDKAVERWGVLDRLAMLYQLEATSDSTCAT